MSSPVPNLRAFPAEILEIIFSFLCCHCTGEPICCDHANKAEENMAKYERWNASRLTLACVCLTCGRFDQLARPFLYHCFFSTGHLNQALKYLRTIVEVPALSSHVKHAAINCASWTSYGEVAMITDIVHDKGFNIPGELQSHIHGESSSLASESGRSPSVDTMPTVSLDQFQTLQSTLEEYWEMGPTVAAVAAAQDMMNAVGHTFLVDVLLSLITNLEYLSIQYTTGSSFGRYMLPSTELSLLKELEVRPASPIADLNMALIYGIIQRAPKLGRLDCYGCFMVPDNMTLENLTILILRMAYLSHDGIEKLIQACKNLQSFSYQYMKHRLRYNISQYDGRNAASPRQICQALETVKRTLEHLEINVEGWGGDVQPSQEAGEPQWNLKQLCALKSLAIDEKCLVYPRESVCSPVVLYNFTPRSIQRVVVTRPRSRLSGILRFVNPKHCGTFRLLKELKH